MQIFDEMIKNIETLLCIQEFVKDRELMEKHFCVNDIEDLCKYCSMKTPELDSLNIDCEEKSFSRLIQLILNSELHLYTENYKDNVR